MFNALRFSFIKLGYILYIPLKRSVIFLQSWTSTGYFSNSTSSSVTHCRFSPIIDSPCRQKAIATESNSSSECAFKASVHAAKSMLCFPGPINYLPVCTEPSPQQRHWFTKSYHRFPTTSTISTATQTSRLYSDANGKVAVVHIYQCPGSLWAYIVGQDLSDSKSNQLHVDISRFCFYSFWGILFYRFL